LFELLIIVGGILFFSWFFSPIVVADVYNMSTGQDTYTHEDLPQVSFNFCLYINASSSATFYYEELTTGLRYPALNFAGEQPDNDHPGCSEEGFFGSAVFDIPQPRTLPSGEYVITMEIRYEVDIFRRTFRTHQTNPFTII
jgi:hypothetical protein